MRSEYYKAIAFQDLISNIYTMVYMPLLSQPRNTIQGDKMSPQNFVGFNYPIAETGCVGKFSYPCDIMGCIPAFQAFYDELDFNNRMFIYDKTDSLDDKYKYTSSLSFSRMKEVFSELREPFVDNITFEKPTSYRHNTIPYNMGFRKMSIEDREALAPKDWNGMQVTEHYDDFETYWCNLVPSRNAFQWLVNAWNMLPTLATKNIITFGINGEWKWISPLQKDLVGDVSLMAISSSMAEASSAKEFLLESLNVYFPQGMYSVSGATIGKFGMAYDNYNTRTGEVALPLYTNYFDGLVNFVNWTYNPLNNPNTHYKDDFYNKIYTPDEFYDENGYFEDDFCKGVVLNNDIYQDSVVEASEITKQIMLGNGDVNIENATTFDDLEIYSFLSRAGREHNSSIVQVSPDENVQEDNEHYTLPSMRLSEDNLVALAYDYDVLLNGKEKIGNNESGLDYDSYATTDAFSFNVTHAQKNWYLTQNWGVEVTFDRLNRKVISHITNKFIVDADKHWSRCEDAATNITNGLFWSRDKGGVSVLAEPPMVTMEIYYSFGFRYQNVYTNNLQYKSIFIDESPDQVHSWQKEDFAKYCSAVRKLFPKSTEQQKTDALQELLEQFLENIKDVEEQIKEIEKQIEENQELREIDSMIGCIQHNSYSDSIYSWIYSLAYPSPQEVVEQSGCYWDRNLTNNPFRAFTTFLHTPPYGVVPIYDGAGGYKRQNCFEYKQNETPNEGDQNYMNLLTQEIEYSLSTLDSWNDEKKYQIEEYLGDYNVYGFFEGDIWFEMYNWFDGCMSAYSQAIGNVGQRCGCLLEGWQYDANDNFQKLGCSQRDEQHSDTVKRLEQIHSELDMFDFIEEWRKNYKAQLDELIEQYGDLVQEYFVLKEKLDRLQKRRYEDLPNEYEERRKIIEDAIAEEMFPVKIPRPEELENLLWRNGCEGELTGNNVFSQNYSFVECVVPCIKETNVPVMDFYGCYEEDYYDYNGWMSEEYQRQKQDEDAKLEQTQYYDTYCSRYPITRYNDCEYLVGIREIKYDGSEPNNEEIQGGCDYYEVDVGCIEKPSGKYRKIEHNSSIYYNNYVGNDQAFDRFRNDVMNEMKTHFTSSVSALNCETYFGELPTQEEMNKYNVDVEKEYTFEEVQDMLGTINEPKIQYIDVDLDAPKLNIMWHNTDNQTPDGSGVDEEGESVCLVIYLSNGRSIRVYDLLKYQLVDDRISGLSAGVLDKNNFDRYSKLPELDLGDNSRYFIQASNSVLCKAKWGKTLDKLTQR